MKDLILSHCFFLEDDEIEKLVMKPYPPLGLLYLSAFLKRMNFKVSIFDTTFASRKDYTDLLKKNPGGIIGLYTTHMTRSTAVSMIKEAKESDYMVILGGPDSANYPEKYLETGADVVVKGEGESVLVNLLPALESSTKNSLYNVKGIVFKDDSGAVRETPNPSQLDIKQLPWPDRSAVAMDEYLNTWKSFHGYNSLNLITARGCAYRCKWCSHAIFRYTYRRRDYLDCANEVEAIKAKFNPDRLWYADDVFTIDHEWISQFSNELRRRKIQIPFETITRADRLMDRKVIQDLADMGCYRIWIGSESGSDRILKAMNRGVKSAQIQWVTEHLQKAGIAVGFFLMWGYKGETFEDIQETVEHVKQTQPDYFFTTIAYPIKNTPYYRDIESNLVHPADWTNASDKDYIVSGRPSEDYYRLADMWLKAEVEAEKKRLSNPDETIILKEKAKEARIKLLSYTRNLAKI